MSGFEVRGSASRESAAARGAHGRPRRAQCRRAPPPPLSRLRREFEVRVFEVGEFAWRGLRRRAAGSTLDVRATMNVMLKTAIEQACHYY